MHRQGVFRDPSERFLEFSILPTEEQWWRMQIEAEDLLRVRHDLGHWLDGQNRLAIIPQNVALTGALYPGCPWSDRVAFVEGENAPRVLVGLGDRYSYRAAYTKAREKRDPHLSPHGLFRDLRAGFHKHAFQFMQQFGPLFIDSPTRLAGDSWWLSLADFWDRHARFVAVARLWEDRFDADKLREHWTSIEEHHDRLDRAGDAPLGYIPDLPHKFICFRTMPWQWDRSQADLFKANASMRQRLVYELVHCELILHTQHCVLTWTAREPDERSDALRFEPTRCFGSLWGAIWDLFGLDTRHYGWRLCQLCAKLFYPKDHRSVCCSTKHQSLWSKRVWARNHRAAMKDRGINVNPRRNRRR